MVGGGVKGEQSISNSSPLPLFWVFLVEAKSA